MKKRFLVFALCACMALSFGACGKSESDVRGNVKSESTVEEKDDEDTTSVEPSIDEVDEEETVAAETEETEEVTEEAAPAESSDEEAFSIGSSNGGTYTNEYFGFGCSLVDWSFLSDDEIRQVNEAAAGAFGDDYAALMEKAQTITDMQATNANQVDTLNVTIEKLPLAAMTWSELDYINSSVETLKSTLANGGINVLDVNIDTVTFAGANHAGLYLHADYMGYDLYERLTVVKKSGYVAVVGASSFFEDNTEAYMNNFYAVD